MTLLDTVLADLAAEGAELDDRVADLDDSGWRSPTPAAGWTIAHQIAHLAWTDRAALLAIRDPEAFAREAAALWNVTESPVDAGPKRAPPDQRPTCSRDGGPVAASCATPCGPFRTAAGSNGSARRCDRPAWRRRG